MSTDNPTHAELVAPMLILARSNVPPDIQELLVAGNPMMGVPPGVLRAAIASFIDSQASRIEELEADNKRQTEALQAIDRIVENNIKDNGTDINRMNIDGEWFTGPPVDACFRILRAFQEVARAALGGKP